MACATAAGLWRFAAANQSVLTALSGYEGYDGDDELGGALDVSSITAVSSNVGEADGYDGGAVLGDITDAADYGGDDEGDNDENDDWRWNGGGGGGGGVATVTASA